MDVNKLVESIVAPFLCEDTNLEYDNAVVPAKDGQGVYGCDDKTENHNKIDECGILRRVLSLSAIPSIQQLGQSIEDDQIQSFITQKNPNVDMAWDERNQMMADKLGYDLIDYIDGDEKYSNPEVNVSLGDEHTFMDISGQICEEYSVRDKIRHQVKHNTLKKKFINENKQKLLKLICENNPTGQIQGGTRDMAPFASLQGYKKFSRDRATITGYEITRDLFDDHQIFAVEDVELKFKSNKIKIYGEDELDSNIVKLQETFKEIGKLYNEYIKAGNFDHAKDRDYDNTTDEFTDDKKDTPSFDDSQVPTGTQMKKLDGKKPNINKGYSEIDPKKKSSSKVDKRVNSVNDLEEWVTASERLSDDGSENIKLKDGEIGKGNSKESGTGTPCVKSTDCKKIPVKKQYGSKVQAKKPYTHFTNKNGEDESQLKQIKEK